MRFQTQRGKLNWVLGQYAMICALVAPVFAIHAIEDKITLVRDREVVPCIVKTEELNSITVEVKDKITGKSVPGTPYQPKEIFDIEWDISEPEWAQGVAAFKAGNYGKAVQAFNDIVSDKEVLERFRPAAKPYLFYMFGSSLLHVGDTKNALAILDQFTGPFKNSRHMPSALGDLIEAATAQGAFDKTAPLLTLLRGMGGESASYADYYEGQMLLAQNKVKEAESHFQSAAAGGAGSAKLKAMASLGMARCAMTANNFTQARDLAKKALELSNTKETSGDVWLMIGDATFAEAGGKNLTNDARKDMLVDAALAYLRVIYQYPGNPVSEPTAILRAGEAFQKLSTMEGRNSDRERATSMYGILTSRYRGSSYAEKAEANMKKFQN